MTAVYRPLARITRSVVSVTLDRRKRQWFSVTEAVVTTPTLPASANPPNPVILVAQLESDLTYTDQSGSGTLAHAGAVTYEDGQLMVSGSTAIHIDADALDPETGCIAFRFRRKSDTGSTEILLSCGADLDDWLRILIDTDDKLYMYWASNGGLPQIVGSTETIAVDTEYFAYFEWDGITQALSLDNGAKVIGTRDVVSGTWGAGDLILKAV